MTSKVDPAAKERLRQMAAATGARMQDVLSAALLFVPQDLLAEKLKEREAQLSALPKPLQNLLKHIDQLSDEDRAMLKEVLGEK